MPEQTRQVAHYYSCLINSLVLFAASPGYLQSLAGPVFDPVFELTSEYEYAFSDPAFGECFASGKVNETLREDLLTFASQVEALPNSLWAWDELMTNPVWFSIRLAAEELLTKMGETRRTFDFDFTVIIPG